MDDKERAIRFLEEIGLIRVVRVRKNENKPAVVDRDERAQRVAVPNRRGPAGLL